MIERAEEALRAIGFRVCRVRHHDLPGAVAGESNPLARLEIGRDELPRLLDPVVMDRLHLELTAVGYRHVTVDLRGYRMGSLNEGVHLRVVN